MANYLNVLNLKTNHVFKLKEKLYQVMKTEYSQMQQRQGTLRVKVRNLHSGATSSLQFISGDKVLLAHMDKLKLQYLYFDSNFFVFMNSENYEQVSLPEKTLSWEKHFLTEGTVVDALSHEGKLLSIALPEHVTLLVTEADPAVKGDTATSALKKAICETGLIVQVPLFINVNDRILVDTTSGNYLKRS